MCSIFPQILRTTACLIFILSVSNFQAFAQTNQEPLLINWIPSTPLQFYREGIHHSDLENLHLQYFDQSAGFDFMKVVDTCSNYLQLIHDSMLVLESKGLHADTAKYWDALFEKKYVIFQHSIPLEGLKSPVAFAVEVTDQFSRLDMMAQEIIYPLKISGEKTDSTTTRFFSIRAEVEKIWIYSFLPATNTSHEAKLLFIVQNKIISKKGLSLLTRKQQERLFIEPTTGSLKRIIKPTSLTIGGGLTMRKVLTYPEMPASSETGKVVINVCVDKDGNVTSAGYTMRGSTSQNKTLIKLAESTARKIIFEPDREISCGNISFYFNK